MQAFSQMPKFRNDHFAVLMLTALPFLLLAIDNNWIFSDLYNDPWIYFGYFLNLPEHLKTFDDAYFGDRLTVLIPGYLFHRLLPDLWAHVLLHLVLYEITILSTYLTLRLTVGIRGALYASMAMGTNFYVLKALGWDYVDGFGMAYLAATILFLILARKSRWRGLFMALAGASGVSTLISNPGYVDFLMPIGILIIHDWSDRPLRRVSRDLAFLTLGAVVLLSVLELCFYEITGKFCTFQATRLILSASTFANNSSKYESSLWGWHACWLAVPAAMGVGGFILLTGNILRGSRSNQDPETGECCFSAILLATIVVCTLSDLFTASANLQLFFYSSLFLPSAFLTLGALSARLWRSLTPKQYICVIMLSFVLFLTAGLLEGHIPPLVPIALAPIVAAVIPGVLSVFLAIHGRGPAAAVAFSLLLGLSQVVASQSFRLELCLPPRMSINFYNIREFDHARASVTRVISETARAILEDEPSGRSLFWFDVLEPPGILFKAVSNTHGGVKRSMACAYFPGLLPSGKTEAGWRLVPGMKVVILSSSPDRTEIIQAARRTLGALRLDLTVRAVRKWDAPGIHYTTYLTRLRRLGSF
jgi:hypothetical protein